MFTKILNCYLGRLGPKLNSNDTPNLIKLPKDIVGKTAFHIRDKIPQRQSFNPQISQFKTRAKRESILEENKNNAEFN